MKIEELALKGVYLITLDKYPDYRGYFMETFNFNKLTKSGVFSEDISFCQDNESYSQKGVIRGLHYQKNPFEQGKLVRVISGKILDVIVDIRKNSDTFGNYLMQELDDKNKRIMWIPQGFAHGFAALKNSVFAYKVSNQYMPSHEAGIRWNDSFLNIPWPVKNPIVSENDRNLPNFNNLQKI